MHLLHVIASMDPHDGGTVQWIHLLHRELKRRGHWSSVISFDAPDAGFLRDSATPVVATGPSWAGRYSWCPGAVAAIRTAAAGVDAIVVDGVWRYHGLAATLAARRSDVPVIVFPHGMLDPWFRYRYPLKHLKKLAYWLLAERHVLARARAVVFTNAEEARLAARSFPLGKWHERTVRFGIGDGPAGGDANAGRALRDAFLRLHPNLADRRLLLFLGRIHEKKGCDLLLQAFAAVRDRDPRLHLVVAGPAEPAMQARLHRQAETAGLVDRLTFIDFVAGDQKWGLLHAAELFCLPSHQENFGIAIVEALACGTPVLISNKVNIHSDITLARAGLVVDDSVDGVVAGLAQWLILPDEGRQRMRDAARPTFERQFHISRAVDDLLSFAGPIAHRGLAAAAVGNRAKVTR